MMTRTCSVQPRLLQRVSPVRDYAWPPDYAIFREYNCEEQTDAGLNPSLVPEPTE